MNELTNNLLDLPFDLYTRNKIISDLIHIIQDDKAFNILDVGGRNGHIANFRQKCDELYILDIRQSETHENNYIKGNIKKAPFGDSAFDLVLSSELYEHINPEDRLNSLSEMLRISKNYVVLGAPFYSKENEKAECEVNEFFLKVTGTPHPWLEEHIKNSLPKKDELERYLADNGYEYFVYVTNNILNWHLLQYFVFYSYKYGLPADKVNAVYRFYNENFIELGDFIEPTYRRIYVIGKKGSLPQDKLQKLDCISNEFNVIKYQKLISLVFDGLRVPPELKNDHIQNLEFQMLEMHRNAEVLEQGLQDKDVHIQNLEFQMSEMHRNAEVLEQGLQDKDVHIQNLESQMSEMHQNAEVLERGLQDKDVHIQNLESQISEMHRNVEVLEQSLQDKDVRVQGLESHISEMHQNAEVLEQGLQDKDVRIQGLESQMSEMDRSAEVLEQGLQDKDVCIQGLESHISEMHQNVEVLKQSLQDKDNHIQNLENQIDQINRFVTFQILTKYQCTIEKVLPKGTGRRHTYDCGFAALKIIVNEGWSSFWFKVKRKLTPRIPFLRGDLDAVPLIETNMLNLGGHTPLSLDKCLSGEFTFPSEGLNEIKIFTATHKRANSDLTLCIRNSLSGSVIRSANVSGSAIQDNDYTSFRFKPIKDSANKTFFFDLKSEEEPHASVWYNPRATPDNTNLYYGQQKLNGGINLQVFSNLKLDDVYHLWRLKNEPSEKDAMMYKKDILSFKYMPKISIITPVWNTDEKWLRLAIESVLDQIYENWELCIVDGNSDKPHVKRVLKKYAEKDSRIKVKFLPENKGIAGNSNEALSLATGEFVALLDHDDELCPFALYEVAKLLNERPKLGYIYSDEDKIDEKGQRRDPFFKPDWSPDMFLSCNYLCHLSVIRTSIVDDVGGFRSGYDGSQDYDLFLRVIEQIDDDLISHIPKILYHWRIIPKSAASSCQAKPYAYTAGKKALKDAMIRRGAEICYISDGVCVGVDYRVIYRIKDNPKISIIIPTRDNVKILKKCINSILANTKYDNYEIIVVDNQSREVDTFEYYKTIKNISKIKILDFCRPFNFSAMNNYAISKARSEYILLLNNDIEVINSDWLSCMLEHAQKDNVGAVGAKLLYPDGTIQHAGVILGIGGVAGHSHKCYPASHPGYFTRIQMVQNFSAVTAACMLTKKSLFEEVGGFDERNLSIAFNDIDYCLKLRQNGYLVVYTPYAELYHHESLSRGYEDTPEKQQRFLREVTYMRKKWGDVLDHDPYYNPNLSRNKEDFSIRI